jgi:hypothetical protein
MPWSRGDALEGFDTTRRVRRHPRQVMYVLSRIAKPFSSSLAPGVMQLLDVTGVEARYSSAATLPPASPPTSEHRRAAPS